MTLAFRLAAASLLLVFSAAALRSASEPDESKGKSPVKTVVARKSSAPSSPFRAEPGLRIAAPESADPVPGVRESLTVPAYLRLFLSGTPHGHRDPPA
jgi:hypothetical protein